MDKQDGKQKKVKQPRFWICFAFVIAVVIVAAIPFIINESYKTGGYTVLWDAADMLIFYGACLTMMSTVIIGIIAINVNIKANQFNAKLTELQIKDRMSFITIDLNYKVRINFNDNKQKFVPILKESFVHFDAYFVEQDETVDDAIIIELNIKNISNNYITGIYLEELEITSYEEAHKALLCDSDNNVLVEPGETRKATILIRSLPKSADKKPTEIISYEANIKLLFVTTNLVGEGTKEYIDVLLEQTARIDEDIADYKPRIDEFRVCK